MAYTYLPHPIECERLVCVYLCVAMGILPAQRPHCHCNLCCVVDALMSFMLGALMAHCSVLACRH